MQNVKNSSENTRLEMVVALALVFVAILTRFVPHAPNFSPTLAIALFAGAMFTGQRLAYSAPMAMILLSDWALGFYPGIFFVYLAYVLTIALGTFLKKRQIFLITLAGMASSMVFFVTSNFGVWLRGGIYEHTWQGLTQCFMLAIPFFHNTLISTMLGLAVLFGLYELAVRFWVPRQASLNQKASN